VEIAAPPAALPDPFAAPWTEPEVSAAMAELPELFRDTIMLVDVEGLTYEEAAAAMACAVGTVRSRLFRARRILSAALGNFARRRGMTTGKAELR
jgi:RNA polymerase sigma-70 factor (ECF subfamily)